MSDMGRILLTEKPTKIVSSVEDAEKEDVVASQSKKFSTNYKSKKIDELYSEFDSINLSKEEIEESNARSIGMKKRKFKKSLTLVTGMIVTVMLAFLAIFNIFVIKDYSKSIDSLQRESAEISNRRKSVQELYNEFKDEAKMAQKVLDQGYKLKDNQ